MDINNYKLLKNITSHLDLKNKSKKELNNIAKEIRELIIEKSKETDLHLSSNLGVIELTISILNNFDPIEDFILFDTGHQTYAYKILTGRLDSFINFKITNDMCALMNMNESIFDKYSPGHSGNILSVASGIYQKYVDNNSAKNNLYINERNIVTIIGDSSFANGLNFEALNDVSFNNEPIIIILNDNGMSISKSVGYTSKAFNKMKLLKSFHYLEKITRLIFGYSKVYNLIFNVFNWFQWRLIGKNLFECLGYQYIGPIPGHDIQKINSALVRAKWFAKQGPVLVHVKTNKGKGMTEAESDSKGDYHSLVNNEVKSYGAYATNKLIDLMTKYDDIRVINPAMTNASNCHLISKLFPKYYIDVGIAEEHAISKASGIALNHLTPYVYIYSTFLQRSYDQLLHDISRLKLKCNLLIDRADISSWEGDTHHGIYDVSLLKTIPNTIITMPRNKNQLKQLIELSYFSNKDKIWAIRYLKTDFININLNNNYQIKLGEWEIFEHQDNKSKTIIISYGPYVNVLYSEFYEQYNVDIANAIFINEYNKKTLTAILNKYDNIIVYERIYGDFGIIKDINSLISKEKLKTNVISLHYKDNIGFGKQEHLERQQKMHISDVKKVVENLVNRR